MIGLVTVGVVGTSLCVRTLLGLALCAPHWAVICSPSNNGHLPGFCEPVSQIIELEERVVGNTDL